LKIPVAFLFVVTISLSGGSAHAQDSGLAFLGIGPDASGMALGDAGVAIADGPFATERNPAGLANPGGSAIGMTHHQWIAGVRTYGLAGKFFLGQTGLGLYARATGSGDLAARDRPGPANGTFDVQFVVAGLGLARSIGPLRVGVGAKYLSERIFTAIATGYAIDVGVQLALIEGVQLGAVFQNMGSMESLADRPTELPHTFRIGASVQPFRVLAFEDGSTLFDALLTAEISRNTVDGRSNFHFGASANVLETVRLRLGYLSNDALRDFSAGLGITAGSVRIDYAVIPFEAGFGGPGHIFTLIYAR
jgi:hypothetical protein